MKSPQIITMPATASVPTKRVMFVCPWDGCDYEQETPVVTPLDQAMASNYALAHYMRHVTDSRGM